MTMERLLVSIQEAAQVLGLGETMTSNLIRSGELVSAKFGRRRLVTAESLRDLVERRAAEAKKPASGSSDSAA